MGLEIRQYQKQQAISNLSLQIQNNGRFSVPGGRLDFSTRKQLSQSADHEELQEGFEISAGVIVCG